MRKKMKNYKKFEDLLVPTDDRIIKFSEFGEFRKGSSEFGPFIQDLMMFLRNFKNDENNLIFRIKNIKFDIDKLYNLTKSENMKSLVSFNVKFMDSKHNEIDKPVSDGYVEFSNLNTKMDRPWENLQEEPIGMCPTAVSDNSIEHLDEWENLTDEEKVTGYYTCMLGDNFTLMQVLTHNSLKDFLKHNKISKETVIKAIRNKS